MRSTPRSARRSSLLFSCALAAVLAATLFLTLNVAASTVPPRSQDGTATPVPAETPTPEPTGFPLNVAVAPVNALSITTPYTGSAINPSAGTQGTAADRARTIWVGTVVSTAGSARDGDGYIGQWEILISPLVTKALIVDGTTRVQNLPNPPKLGDRIEAHGRELTNSKMQVERFRPYDYVPGQVMAQLVSSSVLTDVATQYGLEVFDARMANANIYLFQAVSPDVDEQNLARQLISDTAKIAWAGVNATVSIPSNPTRGDPYRTWKWGGFDPRGFNAQYAWDLINYSAIISSGLDGTGITVAVLDTGIDATHPALETHTLPGRDVVSNDDFPQDGPEANQLPGVAQGHGTHVSGVIVRMAPQAMILPIRVLDQNGLGDTFSLAYAITYAVDQGADVINMSLGADMDDESRTLLSKAVQYAIDHGVIVVAAAGNDDRSQPQYPAGFPNVISVTAVDDLKAKADFANFGDGWIAMAAPGVGITSTVPLNAGVAYAAWSGTSMATPFLAGAAVLVHQKFPDYTPAEVRDLLFRTGIDLNPYNPNYPNQLGHLLDLGAALANPMVEPTPTLTPSPTAEPATPTPQPTPPDDTVPTGAQKWLFLPALLNGN